MSGIFRTFNLLDDEIAVEVGKTIYGRWQRAVGQGRPVGIDWRLELLQHPTLLRLELLDRKS